MFNIIEACCQCKYCIGNNCCIYLKISRDINNVTKIPGWCPLLDIMEEGED